MLERTKQKIGAHAKFIIYPDLGDFSLTTGQFEELWKQHPEEHGKVRVYGKEFDMPRWCKSYGKSYFFSGKQHEADPLDKIQIDEKPFLQTCIDYLNNNGYTYNQILVNWYGNNQHYISDHSDDESSFTGKSRIVCFNYCMTPRDVVIKKKDGKKRITILKHNMDNNTGYEMRGSRFQKDFTHGIPKRKSDPDRDERRISLTFRSFV